MMSGRISCRYAASMGMAVLAGLPGYLSAQPATSLGAVTIESSTISDRFTDQRSNPSSTAVIQGEAVDRAHPENIQQLLQGVPGVTTEVQGGDSLKIHIRGVENQRFMGEKPGVAVVIDGVPVFERTGRVNIDLDNIESVRVIKGGASYLFGEDALAGAVVITTKRGARHGVKLAAERGAFGFDKKLARAGYARGDVNAHVQVSRRQSDGYHFQSYYKADYANGKLQYLIDDWSDLTLGFEVADRDKDSHGTVRGVTQAEEDPESVEGRDYARMFDVALDKVFLTYNRDFVSGANWMANVYRFADHTEFGSAPQKYDENGDPVEDVDAYTQGNDYHQVQRGVKSELRMGAERTGWLFGVDLRDNRYANEQEYITDFKRSPYSRTVYEAGTITEDNETEEAVQALYAEFKYRPAPDWTLTANGRYDHIRLDYTSDLQDLELDRTFEVPSWRLGVNHDLSDRLALFANASTGFRTPTIEQLFAGSISPFGDTASNPDLDPERALNLEFGLRGMGHLFGLPVNVEAAIFEIQRDDYIMPVAGQYADPESGTTDQYQNIGGMRNRGLELAVTSDASRRLSFDLAYTYLDARFTDYDNFNLMLGKRWRNPTIVHYDNTGNDVPRVPEHHLNLTVTGRVNERLTLSGELDATSRYYADEINQESIDGRGIVNLLANYDFRQGGADWSLFARIDNLFDEDYYNTARGFYDSNADGTYDEEDLSLVVNPGRVWRIGASVEF